MWKILVFLWGGLLGAQDTQSHFDAFCMIRAIRNAEDTSPVLWGTACHLDDMADTTVYNNRFRVIFYGVPPVQNFSMPQIADYVKVEAVGGGMILKTTFWGDLVVMPSDPKIRKHFDIPSVYEIRPQRLQLTKTAKGLELLITEPGEDFHGKLTKPSEKWFEDYFKTFQLLGKAR